jgi:hypothetical protein
MTRVHLDETLRQKLLNLQQPLELCDDAGKVVGVFTPMTTAAEPLLSEEELQRREQEPDYSTEEVLAQLRQL